MNTTFNLEKHKSIISVLFEILPLAIPRFKHFLFIKKENELNSIVSRIVSKYYFNDLCENNKNLDDDINYLNLCEAYDYILNVIDNAGEKYDEDKIANFKTLLNI